VVSVLVASAFALVVAVDVGSVRHHQQTLSASSDVSAVSEGVETSDDFLGDGLAAVVPAAVVKSLRDRFKVARIARATAESQAKELVMWEEWTIVNPKSMSIPAPLYTDMLYFEENVQLAISVKQQSHDSYLEVLSSKDYGNWFLHVWGVWLSQRLLALIGIGKAPVRQISKLTEETDLGSDG